ncbi:MAG: hypothetical protein PWR00_1117 [Thermovirga sp.]|jgi:hypothetical protein|nr:hypothetical protein [Thermovirga sp.]
MQRKTKLNYKEVVMNGSASLWDDLEVRIKQGGWCLCLRKERLA